MDKYKVDTIEKRTWKDSDIQYWINPTDDTTNAIIMYDNKRTRLRAGIIIINGDEILLGKEFDDVDSSFSLPGGGIEEGETPLDAAVREAKEEVNITVKNAFDTHIDYCECHSEVKDWVIDNVPKDKWWYNYYTCLIIGEYDKKYKGYVDAVDKDESMKSSSKFYKISDVINHPSFKEAWKKALIKFGYYNTPIEEAYTTPNFKLGTAGYILEDGSFAIVDEYHGEESEYRNLGLPEFSNTYPEEDTCVRIYKEPNSIQYEKLIQIIDQYLDSEGYCKAELWDSPLGHFYFYKVFSLFEGACEDTSWDENMGNWTGYKIVQILKNNINKNAWDPSLGENLEKSAINEATRTQLVSKSKKGLGYADKSKGNRWTRKSKCKVANTVKDYNKIDMDTFWKKDILKVGINVQGETGLYIVNIEFKNILRNLVNKVTRNNNRLELKLIYEALLLALNSTDVKVDCSCEDFKYRFKFWSTQNGYNAGQGETREAKITNPNDNLGAACKHILAVLNNAEWLNKVASVINNYVNYCKDNMELNYKRYIFPKIYGLSATEAERLCQGDSDETLPSDEALINLSNALGRVRGRIQKGSNKNPIAQRERDAKNSKEQSSK